MEYVVPDYYAKYPKPCMGGWGRKLMLITPNGDALPCHAARVIPGLPFENVKNRALREIWEESDAFQKFRGEAWMQEPCKTCDRRALDFGGCRCQALLLAADATATDPVCSLSPQRSKVDAILASINDSQWHRLSLCSDISIYPEGIERPRTGIGGRGPPDLRNPNPRGSIAQIPPKRWPAPPAAAATASLPEK